MSTQPILKIDAADSAAPAAFARAKRQPKLTSKRLREVLSYDPSTGEFRWISSPGGGTYPGDLAGFVTSAGYLMICVDGENIHGHRLAYLWMTGEWAPVEIDHRDFDRLNNKWENLRAATRSQNMANRRRMNSNKSGYKGVSLIKRSGKWRASLSHNRKFIHIGCFDTPAEAHLAYAVKALQLHGEFAWLNDEMPDVFMHTLLVGIYDTQGAIAMATAASAFLRGIQTAIARIGPEAAYATLQRHADAAALELSIKDDANRG